MEIKKYPKADLDRKHDLIFSFSMLITMSLVVTAFEWKQYEKTQVDLHQKTVNEFEAIVEIPPTELQPPPPPMSSAQPKIVEIPDEQAIEEIHINLDIEITQETKVEEVIVPEIKIEKEETDEVFVIVETPAEPKGGMSAFYKDIADRIKYPAQARRMQIEGKVFVEFIVNKDGYLTDLHVVKGIGAGCDEEAVRVIRSSPPWSAGKQRGKPVKQRMVLPITFKLSNS